MTSLYPVQPISSLPVVPSGLRTCVADAGVVDLDAHLVGPRRQYLDILVAELLARAPGDGGLAGDGLRGGGLASCVSDEGSSGAQLRAYLSFCRHCDVVW